MPGYAGTITLCKRTIAILILGVACVYVWALAGVVWTAACAPTSAQGDGVVLVLGKRLTQGRVDTEFQSRLARGAALLRDDASLRGLISGGGGPVSEARAGLIWLRGNGCQADWQLEEQAANTVDNWRLSGALLGQSRVLLVSSRTHLARARDLGEQLGWRVQVVAAEDRLDWSWPVAWAMAREAAYRSWTWMT